MLLLLPQSFAAIDVYSTISFAINYWSKGEVQANFLRHEGYLGAIGAFLKGAESLKTENYSWGENLYGSSAFPAQFPLHSRDSKAGVISSDWFVVREIVAGQ